MSQSQTFLGVTGTSESVRIRRGLWEGQDFPCRRASRKSKYTVGLGQGMILRHGGHQCPMVSKSATMVELGGSSKGYEGATMPPMM